MELKTLGIIAAASTALIGAAPPDGRIGLRCTTRITKPTPSESSVSLYVVDQRKRRMLSLDSTTGKLISSDPVRIEAGRFYVERVSDGHTNGGLPIHHYETLEISRQNGRLSESFLSTTYNPLTKKSWQSEMAVVGS